ncbi:MAG: hypothetical protein M0P99_09115, partial [Candidatus Cloacimonetes bacterium]|nr:hypothetical protein [Candidatus Cloacimonadota bacterium]
MKRSVPILLSAVMMMLFLFGCGDDTPAPFQQYSSMLADGSNSVNRDNSLQVSSLGKAFYISDDIIFHLGDRLTRQSLNTGELIALSPTASLINDKRYLAIDRATQMLYFAADKAIYRAGFAGQGLTKVSPEGNGDYSAPALSSCGQYLTAIRDEHISRLNLSTLEWTDLTEPDSALYAVYASDENAYYYFFYDKGDGYTNNFVGLNKYDNSTQENTLLMIGNDLDPYSNHNTFEAQVSENHRYFAMQFVWETLEDVGMFGSTWLRFPDTLRLYDRLNGQL